MTEGYAQAMQEMALATAEIRGAAKFIRDGLDAKDMDPITLILHFLGELKKSPLSRDAALGIFVVAVHHLVETEIEVERLLKELDAMKGSDGPTE